MVPQGSLVYPVKERKLANHEKHSKLHNLFFIQFLKIPPLGEHDRSRLILFQAPFRISKQEFTALYLVRVLVF